MTAVAALMDYETEKPEHTCWVRPWVSRHGNLRAYNALMKELEAEDARLFCNFLRMSKENFAKLLDRVSPVITKKDFALDMAVPPGEELAITLRYLATGDSYKSMEYLYRVPQNTIREFVPDVCQAVYDSLKEDFLKVPSSEDEWIHVAKGFEEKWQSPHCTGALDGKHITIKAPSHSGSTYYNYKNYFSIVLLALVDADYKFTFVDVGANGRVSDAGIFANSSLAHALDHDLLKISPPSPLNGRHEPVPYVIVGDDAFPLRTHIMKPYPFRGLTAEKTVFNYSLSRARRVSENAFGILVNRFGDFQRSHCRLRVV